MPKTYRSMKVSGGRLDYRSSSHDTNNGHTLAEWAKLYRRNPRAVPPEVQKTLKRRNMI